MTDAADMPPTEQARILHELLTIRDDRKRSRRDREKADRAYRQLTTSVRTSLTG